MSTGPLDGLSDIDAATVVRCARTLLRRPLLREGGHEGELLALAYRHRAPLQELFASLLGYRLVVERRFARLYKAGAGGEPGAGTRGPAGLTPRGYAYFALGAAVLTGAGRQVLLSRLVADVRAAATRLGLAVPDDIGDRRALTAALRRLVALGVLTETEGTVGAPPTAGQEGDTETAEAAEALITVDVELLATLPSGPLAAAGSAEELLHLAAGAGSRGVEQTVRRRLVENPVVLYADLPDEQAGWLRGNARRESWLLEKYFGLSLEVRAEGVLAADPEDYLSDVAFPGLSSPARMASLALPELLGRGTTGPGGTVAVGAEDVNRVCADLVTRYPAAWSKRAVEDRAGLVTEVLAVLRRAGLARWTGSGSLALSPAAHRWEPVPEGEQEQKPDTMPEPAEPALFDVDFTADVDSGDTGEREDA